MKEIQGSLGFWIPRHGFRIHVLESRIFVCGTWISYSIFSWIPDSKVRNPGFHGQNFPDQDSTSECNNIILFFKYRKIPKISPPAREAGPHC